ncbi:MAG: potassium channel protein [Phycisphaerae bacterium]|nr:potassium channel protein [Phycisphaerae bacterium]
MEPRVRVILASFVLLSVFFVGAAGYVVLEGQTFWDSAYMTAITLSTVGYREVFPLSRAGEAWTVLIIAFGIGAVFAAFGTVTAMIIGGEIGRMMGSRKLHAQINQLTGHIIVCGFGRMGSLLVKELQGRRVPVVVVENDPLRTREVEQVKGLYVLGDAAEEMTLKEAGIARAKGLVTVLPHDSDNVFVALTARGLRNDLIIVARAEQHASESKLRRAGANRVISTQVIGATRIANVLTRPHVVDFQDVTAKGVDLEMDEFVIPPTSSICGKTLREAQLRRHANVMVVAIRHVDGRTTFNPGADATLRAEDTIITIGPAGSSSKLKALNLD